MTYPPCGMPGQLSCERVPPTHEAWGAAHHQAPFDDLPLDPRQWRRAQVAAWVARGGGAPARFPMNGKALCLMQRAMFAAREPERGHQLYHDFRSRLAKALALQELFEKMSTDYD